MSFFNFPDHLDTQESHLYSLYKYREHISKISRFQNYQNGVLVKPAGRKYTLTLYLKKTKHLSNFLNTKRFRIKNIIG